MAKQFVESCRRGESVFEVLDRLKNELYIPKNAEVFTSIGGTIPDGYVQIGEIQVRAHERFPVIRPQEEE